MADPKNMWADNVGGSTTVGNKTLGFYVDKECILCSVCSASAPCAKTSRASTQSFVNAN